MMNRGKKKGILSTVYKQFAKLCRRICGVLLLSFSKRAAVIIKIVLIFLKIKAGIRHWNFFYPGDGKGLVSTTCWGERLKLELAEQAAFRKSQEK